MKVLLFFLISSLCPIIGYSQIPPEKIDCDNALLIKNVSPVEKCLSWLKYSSGGLDTEIKALAILDYVQALQNSGKLDEIESLLEQAANDAALTNNLLIIATSSEALARYYYGKKIYKKSLVPLQRAIDNYTSKLGPGHALTIHSLALSADINRLEERYTDSIEIVTRVLLSIGGSSEDNLLVSAKLYNIRALSNEKSGNTKTALNDYLIAAEIMEKVDIDSSIIIWKNIRSFLLETSFTKDTSAVDKRIRFLSGVDTTQSKKWQEQLAPRNFLEISNSSVKQ